MKFDALKTFIAKRLQTELSDKLTYHGLNHTLEVLKNCQQYAEWFDLGDRDSILLQTAALMHDTGFLFTYNDHETESKRYTRELLPEYGFLANDIDKICKMIESTRIPQNPTNDMEKMLADSDLDYLGTSRFREISETLFQELMAFSKIKSREEWNRIQVNFLEKHRYHTTFAREHREPVKQTHLLKLKQIISSKS